MMERHDGSGRENAQEIDCRKSLFGLHFLSSRHDLT
jgi:hypothetical protein